MNAQTLQVVADDSDTPLMACGRVNNVQFQFLNPSTVNVSWDAVPNATSYSLKIDPYQTTAVAPPDWVTTNNSFTYDYRNAPYVYGDITSSQASLIMIWVGVTCGNPNNKGVVNSAIIDNFIHELKVFFPNPSDYNLSTTLGIIRYQRDLAQWRFWTRRTFP